MKQAYRIIFMMLLLAMIQTCEASHSHEIAKESRGSRGSLEKPTFYDQLRIEREWKDRRQRHISRRDEAILLRGPKERSRELRD